MALFVSVNGGDRVSASSVVVYDDGVPIAGAIKHGSIVFYADSVRDPSDLANILEMLGLPIIMAKGAGKLNNPFNKG